MPLDLKSNQVAIDHNDKQYQDVLEDLQGNILKGHGRDKSLHIFLTFPDPQKNPEKIALLKQWIAQLASQDITSAKKQLQDAVLWSQNKIDAGVFIHFSLSSSGYKKLNFPSEIQPKGSNPEQRNFNTRRYVKAFQEGMKERQDELLDQPVSSWEPGFQKQIDALLIIANDNSNILNQKWSEIRPKLKDIATVALEQQGDTVRREFKNSEKAQSIEHFGYVDGVSQPLFFQQDVEKEKAKNGNRSFGAPLSLVLIPDPWGTSGVSFGSFLVFRKLEQNVQAFKKAEVALGNALGMSPKLAGAMAVGRFEDGTPVVRESNDEGKSVNDFDYSGDSNGLKCPFQAHIRKANPRLESVRKDGPFAQSEKEELGHRIARRGVTYGGPVSDFHGNLDNLPERGVGLLFICYQSDIWEQFEFIQRLWSNNPNFLEPKMNTNPNYDQTGWDAVTGQSLTKPDPLIGEAPQPPKNWPQSWGQPTTKPDVSFPQFVTLKGGEYFFSPSLTFLKNLPNLPQEPSTPTQEPTPGRRYVTQEADFLFSIAQRAYGNGNNYLVIYEANKNVIGTDPNVLTPGLILFIPI